MKVPAETGLTTLPRQEAMIPAGIGRFAAAEPINVECEASPTEMANLLSQTAATWRSLGEVSPHWSVLAWDEFANPDFDESKFYDTALNDVAVLKAYFRRAGFDIKSIKSMLELGCGVGRMTAALATEIPKITAVDISAPHLEIAERKLKSLELHNVVFQRMRSTNDLKSLPLTDFFYSTMVLQHNPPPVIATLLSECLGKVTKGGFALFQVPTYKKYYNFRVRDYVPSDRMEMHPLPQMMVFRILRGLGYILIEIQEDGSASTSEMASHTFFAQRINPSPARGLTEYFQRVIRKMTSPT